MGDIKWLRTTFGLGPNELSNLFQSIQGDSNLSSLMCLTVEAVKVQSLVDQRLKDAYVVSS